MRRGVLVLTALLAAGTLQFTAQEPATPQARFRSNADIVQLDVSVLDDKRRPVRGLTAADFAITEDGKPRSIEAFSEVTLPGRIDVAAPWVRDVPADVATNLVADDEGRIVIILLDRSIPVGQPSVVAKRIAMATIEELGPGDLAAVVSTSGGASQNLTSDRTRLLRAINRSDVSAGVTSDAREIEEQLQNALGRDEGEKLLSWTPLNDPRCNCGLCVLDTITSLANAVEDTPRRRKVLFFIGSDLILQHSATLSLAGTDVGCDTRLKDARTTMFDALGRSNLTIHSIDPSGLNNVGPVGRTSSPLAARNVQSTLTRDVTESLQHQDSLKVLPERTGGRAIVNSNAPDTAVPSIFTESASYYLLGFRPAGATANPAFHPVSVKVNRRGVTVHTRSGYVSAAAAPPVPARISPGTQRSSTLRTALGGLLPSTPAAIDVNAAVFAGDTAGRGSVGIVVGVGEFAALSRDRARVPLEIVVSAFDRSGKPRGAARQTLELTWASSGVRRDQRVEVLSKLDLPPGDYEIRAAVADTDPGRTASVFTYATIPSFDAEPLALSNVVVGAIPPTTTAPKGYLSPFLPFNPTAQRDFANTDRILGFLRLYQGISRRDALRPVTLRTLLVDARDETVASSETILAEAQFSSNRTAEHYIALPLATLTTGEYLLRIEAKMGDYSAGRAVRFRMR
jgi:VWFA-related protein